MIKFFRVALAIAFVAFSTPQVSAVGPFRGLFGSRAMCQPAACQPVCCEPVVIEPTPCGGCDSCGEVVHETPVVVEDCGCGETVLHEATPHHDVHGDAIVPGDSVIIAPTPAGSDSKPASSDSKPASSGSKPAGSGGKAGSASKHDPAPLPPAPAGPTLAEPVDSSPVPPTLVAEPAPVLDVSETLPAIPVEPADDNLPADDGSDAGLFDEPAPTPVAETDPPADDAGDLFDEPAPAAAPADGGLFDEPAGDDAGGLFDEPAEGGSGTKGSDTKEGSDTKPAGSETKAGSDSKPGSDTKEGSDTKKAGSDSKEDSGGGLFDDFPFGDEDDKAQDIEDPFGSLRTPGGLHSDQFRLWTDNSGLYRTMGRLSEVGDGYVRLVMNTGHTATVPLNRLSGADLDFVLAQSSLQRVEQIARTAMR